MNKEEQRRRHAEMARLLADQHDEKARWRTGLEADAVEEAEDEARERIWNRKVGRIRRRTRDPDYQPRGFMAGMAMGAYIRKIRFAHLRLESATGLGATIRCRR